jgi:lysophospholipase L1-like esterase
VIRIVALGDSTTAGTPGYLSPLEVPPAGRGDVTSQYAWWLTQKHPEWEVLNRGVNGERTDQIAARFTRDVLEAAPLIVIIIAGVNDVYQGLPAKHPIEYLREMYSSAVDAGIDVVAGSVLPFNTATPDQNARMREVNDWIRNYAARASRMAFVDTRRAATHPRNNGRLCDSPDGLHPSADGYRRVAEALAPALERRISDLTGRTSPNRL